jgi:hypothetical protein
VNALETGHGSITYILSLKHKTTSPPSAGSKIGAAIDYDGLELFQGLLLEQGVLGYHGLGAPSFVHTDKDLESTSNAISVVVREMKDQRAGH